MIARKPADARRREIADAALRLVADQGLARFTALAIAREVGVSDAALFRHFPTMDAIVLAVVERVEEILFEGFPPADPDPIARLGRFFERRVAVIRDNPGVARVVGSELLAQLAPPEGVARCAGFRRRSQAFVHRTLLEARRKGLLADGLAPDEAAVLVLGAVLALGHAGLGSRGLAARVWAALERTLRGGAAAARAPRRTPSRTTPAHRAG
ncbi:MAG TPA: TetR/AcrR family transcriptional regulator [Anaeromyxobacter sp.]|nr:TetR/AcrR family transcriptional regulator [Anaeromyxobacter sp.]